MPDRHTAGSEAAAVAVFTALADPTRRQILDALARSGPATVSSWRPSCRSPAKRWPKHLVQLVDAGLLVAEEPDGRRIRYRARPEPLRAALA